MHQISSNHLCPEALHMLIAHSQRRTWRTPSLSVQVHSSAVVLPARVESMITCGVIVSGSHSSHGSPFFTLPCVPCAWSCPIGPPPSPLLLSASGQRRPAGQAVAAWLKYLSTDRRADMGWLRCKELQPSAALQHSVSSHSYSNDWGGRFHILLVTLLQAFFLKGDLLAEKGSHSACISFISLRSRSKSFKHLQTKSVNIHLEQYGTTQCNSLHLDFIFRLPKGEKKQVILLKLVVSYVSLSKVFALLCIINWCWDSPIFQHREIVVNCVCKTV
jgi:hypothetical protein